MFIGGTGTGKTHLYMSAPAPGGASSTWSTWSISWTPQKPVQDFADIEASGLGRWAKSFEALLWRAPARKH
jgi:hypothetical protein